MQIVYASWRGSRDIAHIGFAYYAAELAALMAVRGEAAGRRVVGRAEPRLGQPTDSGRWRSCRRGRAICGRRYAAAIDSWTCCWALGSDDGKVAACDYRVSAPSC